MTQQTRSGKWELYYVGHVCFRVTAPDGTVLFIDPMLDGGFEWEGAREKRLDPPAFQLPLIEKCDAVLVTHAHGDHYEATTVSHLARDHGSKVLGPPDVIADLAGRGVPGERLITASSGQEFDFGPMKVTAWPNRDSENAQPCNRFSYSIRCGDHVIFHGGDSHGPSPTWEPLIGKTDIAMLWPSKVIDVTRWLRPARIVLMHYGQFRPGKFLCNMDPNYIAGEIRTACPDANVQIMSVRETIFLD
ncbi:MAG TPA: MBL fold metallo-hydrolase [Candidatus Brocadiia bacterium]|nr:MBL fold metallo-hydrolase [Candidatus Brocadiia bacterium]